MLRLIEYGKLALYYLSYGRGRKMVGVAGIGPASPLWKRGILPLNDTPMVEPADFAIRVRMIMSRCVYVRSR